MSVNLYQMKLGPIELLSRPGKMTARVECAACGVHDEWNLSKVPEPAIVKRHFIVRGWELRKAPKCPDCQMKKRERQVTNQKTTTSSMDKATEIIASAMDATRRTHEASDAAKRAKRMIYMALEDYYDESKKCYKNGKTDKAIAEEVGASEAFVRQIREADFGPISQPIAVDQLAADFAAAIAMQREAGQYLSNLAYTVEKFLSERVSGPIAAQFEASLSKLLSETEGR